MTDLALQLAPQRSTQYTELVATLAPVEIELCPALQTATARQPITLAGQAFYRLTLPQAPTPTQLVELGSLATVSGVYELADALGDALGDRPGPWLRPLETGFAPVFPPELVVTRRYRGKTNEVLTHFLCNLARYSSAFAAEAWSSLRVFDPLAGGGTVLFSALLLGAEVAGVEQSSQDVHTTVAYVRQFCQGEGIACQVKEERLKKLGRRWTFALGKSPPRRCLLAEGDTALSAGLIAGFKPHLVVTDLPYGIHHQGPLLELLTTALPVWANLLPPGGAVVFAWDATRFTRPEMIGLVEAGAPLIVARSAPYDRLAHRVDRVIKQRDILVARRI
jgi:hypothetical protein